MPAGLTTKTSPKKPLSTLDNSPDAKPKERNKGGRPSNASKAALYADESKAHESIKLKWAEISHQLADETLKAARDPKSQDAKKFVSLATVAGIAYDKRWSKQVSDTQDIDIPASLAHQISGKLAKPLTNNESANMVQSKPCTDSDEKAEPIDPMLLSPGL